MAHPRRTSAHKGLDMEGSVLEWAFPPWRSPHDGGAEFLTSRPILRGDESLADAFAADRIERKKLARTLPRLTNYRRFYNKSFDACWFYQCELEKRAQPRTPESRARTEKLISALVAAREAYGLLHSNEVDRIADTAAAEEKTAWPWVNLEPRSLEVSQQARVRHAVGMMHRLEEWARGTAAEMTATKGRTRFDAERVFVNALAEMWVDQTGEDPGISRDTVTGEGGGAFLTLCRSLAPDLDSLVKEVLQQRKGEKGRDPSRI